MRGPKTGYGRNEAAIASIKRYRGAMTHSSHSHSKLQEPVEHCIRCGHLESEHGRSGTRPCLAMVGDLLDRRFCKCDRLITAVASALPTSGLTAA